MADPRDSEPRLGAPDAAPPWLGPAILSLLAVLGPILAFSSGAYSPRVYLLPLLILAACSAAAFAALPASELSRPRLAALGLFLALAGWTALSLLWAASPVAAWNDTNRTLLYLLGFASASVGLAYAGRRGIVWLSGAALADVAVVAAGTVARILTLPNPLHLFGGGRLLFPVTYWNGLACLLMIGFWLALGLTLGRWRRRWLEPLLLAVAVALIELAVLPQSRGAFWTFLLMCPVFILVSPHRFRALTNLALVAAVAAGSWSRLVAVYPAVREATKASEEAAAPAVSSALEAIDAALLTVLLSVVAVTALWGLTFLVERRTGRATAGVVRRIGIGIATVAAVVAIVGGVALDRSTTGGFGSFVSRHWHEVVADKGPQGASESRFVAVGLNGRGQLWRVAMDAFRERPLTGLGADNYEPYFYQHRQTTLQVKQAHSRPMDLLAELGLPGFLLWSALVLLAFVQGVRGRLASRDPAVRAAIAAAMLGFLSWLVHSSTDWLWQLAGVTWPAVLLLAGLAAAGREAPAARNAAPGQPDPASHARWRTAGGIPVLRWVGVAVAVVAFVSAAFPYLSLRYTALAYKDLATSQQASLADAGRAAFLNPLSADPVMTQAEIYEQAATPNPVFAAAAWGEALRREPSNWQIAYYAGLAELKLGNADQAKTLLELAARLNPLDQDVQAALKGLPEAAVKGFSASGP